MSGIDPIDHIIWHKNTVSKDDKQKLNQHKSMMIWFTGLSGSGKSTLANALEKVLHAQGIRTYLLDGDNLRHGINKNLGFSLEDRQENIRRIAEVGKLFVDAGVIVLAAAISPFEIDRKAARDLFEASEFIEVYVKCSLDECEIRDPKGLYKKARAGEIKDFTGVSQPYEEPLSPELVLDTSTQSLDETLEQLFIFIKGRL
ncbi:adenylyl-sulfate kinase [Peribacillus cavernae]|uniref:Adenylyl-sulfate kinase n=1 Tax=Peribacillus cavernae TaxID=1674310 RepID=A0A433HLU0_9BACI|nr:adenylyl-sulfate kinase [Peribacillus cavernae]MDQ0218926.1 adenylylsulfate kinase [Peribacillus cavernae]RUQ29361.1 adenylyl-sulfate kinase [Peribacillus cavernae]